MLGEQAAQVPGGHTEAQREAGFGGVVEDTIGHKLYATAHQLWAVAGCLQLRPVWAASKTGPVWASAGS
jgi:hypothetical protein